MSRPEDDFVSGKDEPERYNEIAKSRSDNNAPADDVVARLRNMIADFDDEVADVLLSDSGERSDLWDEIDVPVSVARGVLDLIDSQAKEIERLRAEKDEVVRTRDEKIARALNKADVEAEAAGNAENDLEAAQLRIRELEEGLREVADEFDGTLTSAERMVERARALIERNSK